jgi:uncharacterized protein (TIGR02300 family)
MALAQNRCNIDRLCAPHSMGPQRSRQTEKGLPMPKEEWGTKRLCPTTGKRFYDMNRNPIVSPYTGDLVKLDNAKTRMIAADDEDAVTAKAKAATAVTDGDQVLDEDDVDVDLDDDLLDDDEDEDTVPLDELADVAANEDDI